jgi:hypothetical protein
MDELSRQVLKLFIAMGTNLLIYILFSKPEEMTPQPASEFSMS